MPIKEQARKNLCSRRLTDEELKTHKVESVFGDNKGNFGIQRFLFKGVTKG